jgi:hypothetical protein
MADNDINIIIKLKNLASNELKKVRDGFDNAGNSAKGFRGAVSNLASFLASKFVITLGDVQRMIGNVVRAMKDYIDKAMEQLAVEFKLHTALKATGQEYKHNFEQMKKFARELQNTTTVGDETSLKLMQMATNMGLNADQAMKATEQAIALSRAYDVDLQGALKSVSSAQMGNYDLLKRQIPALRMIKDETKLASEAQRLLNSALVVAKSETETAQGKVKQLGLEIGDLKEKIGTALLEQMNPFLNWLHKVTKGVNDFFTATKQGVNETDQFASAIEKMSTSQQRNLLGNIRLQEEQQRQILATQLIELNKAKAKIGADKLSQKTTNDNIQINTAEEDTVKKLQAIYDKTALSLANLTSQRNMLSTVLQDKDVAQIKETAEKERKLREEQLALEKQLLIATKEEELEFLRQTNQIKLEEEIQYYEDLLLIIGENAEKQKEIQEKISKLRFQKRVDDYNNSKKFSDLETEVGKSTIDELTKLKNSGSKEAFEIGKSASLAQAIINNAEAITKTMANIPYPLNIPLAGAQALAGGAEIAKISSTQFADGGVVKAQQGGVTGSVNGLPSTVAENRSDEAIIPLEDDARVKELMGGGQTVINLIVDGQRIAQAVVNGYNKGRAINTVTKIKES